MSQENRILLATYVDGAYWMSALEIMLYPTACSFYRPFSYRRQWAGSDVTATPQESGALPSGFVGIRFLDTDYRGTRPLFIPLRRVDKIVVRDHDDFHVNFRLGPYIQHPERGKFLVFDLSEKLSDQYQANKDILLATLPGQFGTELYKLPTTSTAPPDIWEKFTDDPNLAKKAREGLVNACVLQLVEVRQRGSTNVLPPTELETLGAGKHERSGYNLSAGCVYDLEFIHRTLTSPGVTLALRSIAYECTAPPDRVRLSRNRIPQTGNYREEQVWVQPCAAEPAPTLLEWEPRDETQPAAAASRPESALSLRIPFLAAPLPWYKFKPGRLWIGMLFIVASASFFTCAVVAAGTSGTQWPAVWVGLGAVCAPIGANMLARWWDERGKLE